MVSVKKCYVGEYCEKGNDPIISPSLKKYVVVKNSNCSAKVIVKSLCL